MVLTERDVDMQQPTTPDRGRRRQADAPAYLPFVPSFGWRPGQSDFPVTLIAASDVFPAGRLSGHGGTRDFDLFPHVEVLSVPPRRRVTPVRVVALLVLVGAATAASWTVFNRASSPADQAALNPTATSAVATATSDGVASDDDVRRSQPGFGGALPSAEEDDPDATETTETTPSVAETPSATATDADSETSSTPIPTAVSVLPGSGVVTVSARADDTLVTIAEKFDVEVASLLWSNDVDDPTARLGEGTLIRVPREDGVIHGVAEGDTLDDIAALYGVDVEAITGYGPNDVEKDGDLSAGELVLVPGGAVIDRGTLDEYVVAEGDTLTAIAGYFGLQPQTLVWANELPDPSLIHAGQTLLVPPGDGALVNVVEGDTVEAIADRFGIEASAIYDFGYNDLGGDAVLQVNQYLMVPGDFLPPLPAESPLDSAPAGEDVEGPATGTFIWPAEGWVSQEFHTGHLGVDIANEAWTPVNAMDGGVVIFAGWSDYGLGYTVGIDHGNGYQTWYGHFAAQPYVEVGQIIWQGGYLGPMGSTGRSSGPHLHLVVLEDGIYMNPLNYLQ